MNQSATYGDAEFHLFLADVIEDSTDDVPAGLNRTLTDYVPLIAFVAARVDDPALVYDRDDAFFIPLSGFRAVTRPGPNVEIYSRSDLR